MTEETLYTIASVIICVACAVGMVGGIWFVVERLILHGAN